MNIVKFKFTDDYKVLEHGSNRTSSNQATHHKASHKTTPHRSTRHIGVPDHGGFQRIIATAGLAPSFQVVNTRGPTNSIDVVFTTYWQYPAKVRVILPEDKACIEHYRKLSKLGKNLFAYDILGPRKTVEVLDKLILPFASERLGLFKF